METPINISEAICSIKEAGADKVRIVPMKGENVHSGRHAIEIFKDGLWTVVAEGMMQSTARDIVRQATNKVICG